MRLTFKDAEVRRSRILFTANGGTAQTFTNELLLGTTPVTSGVTYAVTEPVGYTGPITLDSAAGTVSFGREVYDKVTRSRTPERVTVQATHQGKTASYTFTVTDHFSPRDGHTSVVLNNAIYVIGGRSSNASSANNDVWRSPDGGATWDRLTPEDPTKKFPPRYEHASVAAGGEIYVIGGLNPNTASALERGVLNDVWKSSDGVAWSQVTTSTGGRFTKQSSHRSIFFSRDIYVIGGEDNDLAPLRDVWKSRTGTGWEKLTVTISGGTPFPRRSQFDAVVMENSIYVVGGRLTGGNTDNNVWRSSNGSAWSQVTTSTGDNFTKRRSHTAAALDGVLYVIGGVDTTYRNDVWESADNGANWTTVAANQQALGRAGHGSVVLNGALYVIGGSRGFGSGTEYLNDVWKSANGGLTWKNVHKNP